MTWGGNYNSKYTEYELLKVSHYNRNVKAFRPYLARQNSHVTTTTSLSTTTKIAIKAYFKHVLVWFGLVSFGCSYSMGLVWSSPVHSN